MGSKVKKRYDEPQTPYQRVLASAHVSEDCNQELKEQFVTLNPENLHRKIIRIQGRLLQRAREKHTGGMNMAGGL